jgi:hypothetical protein
LLPEDEDDDEVEPPLLPPVLLLLLAPGFTAAVSVKVVGVSTALVKRASLPATKVSEHVMGPALTPVAK